MRRPGANHAISSDSRCTESASAHTIANSLPLEAASAASCAMPSESADPTSERAAALCPGSGSGGVSLGSATTAMELAIEDNNRYVKRVIDITAAECRAGKTVVMAGFSQGVAMAFRAAACLGRPVGGVIALGGFSCSSSARSVNERA